jgi:hypothetical protein
LQDKIEKLVLSFPYTASIFFPSCASSALPSKYMSLYMVSCVSHLTIWSQIGCFTEFWQDIHCKFCLFQSRAFTTLPYTSKSFSLFTIMLKFESTGHTTDKSHWEKDWPWCREKERVKEKHNRLLTLHSVIIHWASTVFQVLAT